ncbi:hypothetical protein H0A36_27645 [Endozoicomonas sp. SM1973]|uniref:Polysaccharide deacetylase n=1 Tax=Spartinivicinus marinus TaxID=2994442 RepID=A0A853I799_9GAMM|nr:hypothetical protein [Spartinivicinus marinus]MCX4025118.1 hypothetical protein [Spartinivicinus marinus]NYZ69790.1 hypothetical protein [Spartinivicinus marinus]
MKKNSNISSIKSILVPLLITLAFINNALAEGKVVGIISVDWEGYWIKEKDIQKMRQFREDFPEVGMLHFLNAAYYTKHDANYPEITQTIQSVLLPNDEHGLHIHGWRSLVEASGVTFNTSPRMGKKDPISLDKCQPPKDCGHDIDISSYSKSELRNIIRFSKRTLMDEGFDQPVSFRAGGWMTRSNAIQALSEEGIQYDSSAMPPELLKGSPWEKLPLYTWLDRLWSNIDTDTQPYVISRSGQARVLEIPDNGILADYITAEGMLEIFKKNVTKWQKNTDKNIYVSIGFHQESADKYLDRIREAKGLIEAYAQENDIPFEWATFPISQYFPAP